MISQKKIDYFKENGEVKVSSVLSGREIFLIKDGVNNFIKENRKKLKLGNNFNFVKNSKNASSLHRLEKYKNRIFYKLATQKKFKLIAEKLNGANSRLLTIQFFFKNKKENKATPIHQDNGPWCFKNGKGLSFWIALNKTGKKNGILYYYQKSHKKDLKHSTSSTTPGSSQVIKKINKKYKKINYELKAGECVIHDSRTVHGSYENKVNKDRQAFVISFVTNDSVKDKIRQKAYEKNLILANKRRSKLL
jgi:ectoine hydroxylase-related dioxygenase (phytanoyl-CoA dioxygenase family)